MGVKTYAFNLFSAVLSVVVILANWCGLITHRSLAPLRTSSKLHQLSMARWRGVSEAGDREILEYIKILLNIFLGICLSESLVAYHQYLLEQVLSWSHYLCSFILKWAFDVPDYATYLRQSYTIQLLSHMLLLILGVSGLAVQFSLSLDLITLITFPFSVAEIILNRAFNRLTMIKSILVDILTINKKYWVTCPYPEFLLKDTFKIIYICALPLLCYMMVMCKIYSIMFGLIHLIFRTFVKIGFNFALFLEQIGTIFYILAGFSAEKGQMKSSNKSISQKIDLIKEKLGQVDWESTFKFKQLKQVFVGNNSQKQSLGYQIQYYAKLSIIEVYKKISVFFK